MPVPRPWELIQLGNCGSPIETAAGWLVFYSCGSLLHGGTVVLPYGCSDSSVRIATLELAQLLSELTG